MTDRTVGASPGSKARITGVVYLLYFMMAVSAEVFVGRSQLVVYDAANLVAYAFYIAVTLLFYYMFKPVVTLPVAPRNGRERSEVGRESECSAS